MSLDYQRVRRHVNKTASFKQKNAKLDRSKGKTKKNGRNVDVDSPEFQLLVKLYVPSNLLITNNKVDLKELKRYLPIIVNDTLTELNYEIHLFLSCIVSRYVLSWYLLKLNTDDSKFVSEIYLTLSSVVRDLSSRILNVVEGPLILQAINTTGNLLANHLAKNRLDQGEPAYFQEYVGSSRSTMYDEETLDSVRSKFLAASHVVFNKEQNINEEDALSSYCRLLSSKILDSTFDGPELHGLKLSPITKSLMSAILGDLVLKKIILLLAKPEFILENAIGRPIDALLNGARDKEESEPKPVMAAASLLIQSLFKKLIDFMSFWSHQKNFHEYPPLEEYFLVSLLDSVFSVKQRRPVTMHLGGLFLSMMSTIWELKPRLESVLGKFLLLKLSLAPLLEDASIAGIMKILRERVFERVQNKSEKQETNFNVFDRTRDKVMTLYRHNLDSKLAIGRFVRWITDENMKEEDVHKSVVNFLLIFNNGTSDTPLETSDVNSLLVLDIIDCLVKHLYPELTR